MDTSDLSITVIILTIAIVILIVYEINKTYTIDNFQNIENNAISYGIIEEKIKKYDNSCEEARTPVVKTTQDSNSSGSDILKTLSYYNLDVQNKLNNIMDVGDSSNQSALDKIKQSVDLMSLQDKASHYYFLNRLSGTSTN